MSVFNVLILRLGHAEASSQLIFPNVGQLRKITQVRRDSPPLGEQDREEVGQEEREEVGQEERTDPHTDTEEGQILTSQQ